MPEGPLGAPRLTNIGPLSRPTAEEIRSEWNECSPYNFRGDEVPDKQVEICREVKRASIEVLDDQGVFARMDGVAEINTGGCHTIAKRVSNRLDYVNWRMFISRDHSWIEYDGGRYDSEAPNGVSDPFALPLNDRTGRYAVLKHSVDAWKFDDIDVPKPESAEDAIIEPPDEFKRIVEGNSC